MLRYFNSVVVSVTWSLKCVIYWLFGFMIGLLGLSFGCCIAWFGGCFWCLLGGWFVCLVVVRLFGCVVFWSVCC